ncbi:DUF4225 domain-containing protein, partial [Salmonella enterica]|nr:DUF4225 domain-containing protein [Salmonella enterica]EEH2569798.1 DUF4225 domain-containing protein [Salmonella enterica]
TIYKAQGELEAGALKNLVTTASGFINNDRVRYNFLGNAEVFTEAQLERINGDGSMEEKNLALSYLRQEQNYLEKQISWLESKQVKPAASVEIRVINGMLSYIVKGIGLIGGVLQVIGGFGLIFAASPTVVGSAAGALLVLHGFNNIVENGASLFFDNDNFEGPATYMYGEAANLLGVDRAYGKLAFAGVDLALSAYALFGTKLIPDAWRLFRYIPADYEMKFRTMSVWALSGEFSPDAATLYSSSQTYFSLPVPRPDDPPAPLLPFYDN